jgi:hypothetical protein
MDLQAYVPQVLAANSFQDFLKSLVGIKLKVLLDSASFARLYVGNKYGFSDYDPLDANDKHVVLSTLLSNVADYINFRKIGPLRAKLDATDAEDRKRPEVIAHSQARAKLVKAIFAARRAGNDEEVKSLQAQQQALQDPSLYSKNFEDMQALVQQFHNSTLTIHDVTPSESDTDEDKQRLAKAEAAFNALKASMSK